MSKRIEHAETWSHNDVWFCRDYDMWGLTAFDAEGNQVGDTEWFTLQAHAVTDGIAYTASGRCDRTDIYTKWGKLRRTV